MNYQNVRKKPATYTTGNEQSFSPYGGKRVNDNNVARPHDVCNSIQLRTENLSGGFSCIFSEMSGPH